MLLWHDGLNYPAGSTFLAAHYPVSGGLTSSPHRDSGKRAVQSSNGFLVVPHASPTGVGSDTATVGFYIRLDTPSQPANNSTFLEFKTAGGTTKLLFNFLTTASGFKVESKSKVQSPQLAYSKYYFVEIQTLFSSNGKIILRVDGTEVARSENVDTTGGVTAWGQTVFTFFAPPALIYLSDIYVCDATGTNKTFATFLGPISSRKHAFTAGFNQGWGPVNTGQYRVTLAAGQSNMDGGSPVIVPAWRSPNAFVPIWNTATNAWEPVEAGVNSWGHLYFPANVRLPWIGPEMAFAEEVAKLYEASGASSSNVRFIKMGFGASTVLPASHPSLGWHPSIAGGLHSQAVTHTLAAIAALGGPSAVEAIDLFWYQGETETFYEPSVDNFPGPFYVATVEVLNQFVVAFSPIPVRIHLVRIHRYFTEFFAGMVEAIRSRQEYLASFLGSPVISVDDFLSDGAHLYGAGMNGFGRAMFTRWLAAQNYPSLVQDELTLLSPDARWLGSNGTKTLSLSQSRNNKLDLINSPVLAASPSMFCEATTGTLQASLGGKALGAISVPNLSPWASLRQTREGLMSPEQAAKDLNITLQ